MWNLERPDDVREIQGLYIAAGSDVIQTNTFGANRFRLEYHGLVEKIEAINTAAAHLAREVAGDKGMVAGNLGPSGVFLPPVGDGDPAAIEEAFTVQAEILARAGVDFISIETMIDLQEALIALRGARKGAPGLQVSVCMVFEKKKRGFFSPMGNKPGDAARTLTDEGADLVGANCSMGSVEMREMAPEFIAGAGVPVIMKPNAGMPGSRGRRPCTTRNLRTSPATFSTWCARALVPWVDAAERMIASSPPCEWDWMHWWQKKQAID